MDQSHYSKVFGLSLAAALGLMLALSALAQSALRGSTILANPSLARRALLDAIHIVFTRRDFDRPLARQVGSLP